MSNAKSATDSGGAIARFLRRLKGRPVPKAAEWSKECIREATEAANETITESVKLSYVAAAIDARSARNN